MKTSDPVRAGWQTWVDALEARKELVAFDRAFLTAYKTKLSTATTVKEDLQAIEITKKYFNNVVY